MNHDQINKKKQNKIEKHFDITVNGSKVKIMNYKITEYRDEYSGLIGQKMEIITKISNKVLESKPFECLICKDNKEINFIGCWYSTFSRAGLFKYHYKADEIIIKENTPAI
jgi:hypothetical protein